METLDPEACYRALVTRDPRFDGRIFVGVTSTGIYCRPVCPARTAKFEHCRFYASAAAAQEAGFRPCLRCRPETAPDLASWRGTSNTVSRALALIADGGLDGEAGVEALADRLGVGGRQLRRLFKQHLGATPVAVAQTRRVLFAKQMIQETRMPMAEVAMAAGFGSVRRFNETFHDLFRRPPSALRRRAWAGLPVDSVAAGGVTLRLRYRPPYDWPAMLAYLRARAIEGVEQVAGEVYRRSVAEGEEIGTVEVRHEPARDNLAVLVRFPSVRALPGILARVRRVFDVGADIETIGAHLSQDPFLAPLVAQRPGLRAPGGWDGFELAVRAVLGQQVTVVAARQLAGRLVSICGAEVPEAARLNPALSRAFPSPQRVAAADLGALGMPGSRRATLTALAEAAIADPHLFRPFGTVEEAIARLRRIRGIGDWTAQYIALRALREPDAFPASDIGLLRGAADGAGGRPTPADLLQRAEPWRPWRAYAAQHLWAADAGPVAKVAGAKHG
ncbi:AlkA N-terminal domain-containing protein [Inquilinus sp. Marseille-Q2685]|uniref:AlkA N-terminal domain-containing protein n=1 Tax=Inquilinus sp. Marseille-Q2685 TaxID=2866581 RepID=UPI001CE441FB|nr:AlkA N-terminal domain-containing protein [Inquilinus sp. Marseille-Q2685]